MTADAGVTAQSPKVRKRTGSQRLPAGTATGSRPLLLIAATGGWLFLRLCARYGLRPYRRRRQKLTTLTVRAPQGFVTKVLWPQFQAMLKVFVAARAEVDNEILVEWLGREEASATISVEERDDAR